ncbi:hypothetical protein ACF090_43130 [Streptomyces sp. NPDC014892]|uniref:hypothetical protein n=1 Tax=Streptomyces sp. NPDC014892 TaxID=3364930 RepID=UPI00370096D1
MSAAAWSPVSLAVVCAGVGYGRSTRPVADWVAEAVRRSPVAGGARAEVEVLELHRPAADLARYSAQVLSGMPVLPALDSGSRRQLFGLAQVMRRRLTVVHVDPVPMVVLADPADWQATALSDAARLRPCIDRAAVELAAATRSHRR